MTPHEATVVIDISTKLNAALAKRPEPPPPGIYPDIPEHVYHGWWPCASNSRLTALHRSPAHMLAGLDEDKDTDAKRLGRATHCAILEPDSFGTRFACGPDGDRKTKIVKDKWLELEGRVGPGRVLRPREWNHCLRIRDAFYRNPFARAVMEAEGQTETTMVWNDRETGVRCKARVDKPTVALGTMWDLKSTEDARAWAFEKSVFTYGYHRQGALYLDGALENALEFRHYGVIAYEKEPPYALLVYRLLEGALSAGETQVRRLMRRYAHCLERNEYPAYQQNEVMDLTLPSYAWGQIDAEDTSKEIGA